MSFAWFGGTGPVKTPAEYREFAEKCRELAAKLSSADDKRATELMAAAWDKVADECEAAAPHLGRRHRVPLDPRTSCGSSMTTMKYQTQ